MKHKRLIPDAQVRERYGVTAMTLYRWDHDPELGFPKPIYIRNRKYRDERELEEFEASRVEGGADASASA
jgi:predicted DNA-binding transcriptional regulator AlpA